MQDNRSVTFSDSKQFEQTPSAGDHGVSQAHPDPLMPYGTLDLDPEPQIQPGPPRRVRCYHRGCERWLRPAPRDSRSAELCPEHQIRCHYSQQNGPTYSYADVRRNIIVAADLLADQVVRHPFKQYTDQFGFEKSEDALTWNVFRSLQEAGVLREVAAWFTGIVAPDEPRLYLWGLRVDDDSLEPWNLLIGARERFEKELPPGRRHTEPDIALHLPGRYLVLIEAKFTSSNPVRDSALGETDSLSKSNLIRIYQDPSLKILDVEKARQSTRVYDQLWRNMVFAEWMASAEASETRAYLVNLTRLGYEQESCCEFRQVVRPGFAGRFVHRAWEEIDDLWATRLPELARLHSYLATKTSGLVPAFRLRYFDGTIRSARHAYSKRATSTRRETQPMGAMKILGYSERGLINGLLYEIVYCRESEATALISKLFGELEWPALGRPQDQPIKIDVPSTCCTILVEQSFSQFGTADAVFTLESGNRRVAVFLEGKWGRGYNLVAEWDKFIGAVQTGRGFRALTSNVFCQLYLKQRLATSLVANSGENPNDGLNFDGALLRRGQRRVIGNNPVVLRAVQLLHALDDAFYVMLIPGDWNDSRTDWWQKNVVNCTPAPMHWDVSKWGILTTSKIIQFCKDNRLERNEFFLEQNRELIPESCTEQDVRVLSGKAATHWPSMIFAPTINPQTCLHLSVGSRDCYFRDYTQVTDRAPRPIRIPSPQVIGNIQRQHFFDRYPPAVTDVNYWQQLTQELNAKWGIR